MNQLLRWRFLLLAIGVALVVGFGLTKRAVALPPGAQQLSDLAYVENGHQRQKLDLYLPANAKDVPLLIWIHGGGWMEGSKDQPPGLPLLEHGYAVASLNYRFSSQAIFPAQIEDCKAAIRWLRAHANEYGYDPKRIGVWGGSAGGHLVALLALTGNLRDFDTGAHLDQSSAVQCAIDAFGPTDFPGFDYPDAPPMVQKENPDSLLAKLFGGVVSQKLELARRASPVNWVTKEAAPLLIVHGSKDVLVPVDQSQRLADKLRAIGADVTLEIIPEAGHGGPQFSTPEQIKLLADFLNRHLHPTP